MDAQMYYSIAKDKAGCGPFMQILKENDVALHDEVEESLRFSLESIKL